MPAVLLSQYCDPCCAMVTVCQLPVLVACLDICLDTAANRVSRAFAKDPLSSSVAKHGWLARCIQLNQLASGGMQSHCQDMSNLCLMCAHHKHAELYSYMLRRCILA